MASASEHTAQHLAVDKLKSKAQCELMDAVDRLREQGIDRELHLPQLIVCGNQSSGKSSVLEAISHVPFPAGVETTTRYASELILRNSQTPCIKASIQPDEDASVSDRKILAEFNPTFNGPQDFSKVLDQATKHMERLSRKYQFYPHRLRVEISGPQQPHLTLVDLPGLIVVGKEDEVERINKHYMGQPKSIILAVVPASDEFDCQSILKKAKEVDKDGKRTMGILTKPDCVQRGHEGAFRHLIANRKWPLDLGWHVLKNLNSAETSHSSRDDEEKAFFEDESRPWSQIPESSRGIIVLRNKLRDILLQHISQNLPELTKEISAKIVKDEKHLATLGLPRLTAAEHNRFLHRICLDLRDLVLQATQGRYDDAFFSLQGNRESNATLFRQNILSLTEAFDKTMRIDGAKYATTSSESTIRTTKNHVDLSSDQGLIQCEDTTFCSGIKHFMAQRRGTELNGEYQPSLIGDIFKIQSQPWESIAESYIDTCVRAARDFFRLAVDSVVPPHVSTLIKNEIVALEFEQIERNVKDKLDELLWPFKVSHPSASNPGYQEFRDKCDLEFRGLTKDIQPAVRVWVRVNAYYWAAINTFIDNVVVLAVEKCIIHPLAELVNLDNLEHDREVYDLIISEPEAIVLDRENTRKRLETLREVRRICSKHESYQVHWRANVCQEASRTRNARKKSATRSSEASVPDVRASSPGPKQANSSTLEGDEPTLFTPPRTPDNRASRYATTPRDIAPEMGSEGSKFLHSDSNSPQKNMSETRASSNSESRQKQRHNPDVEVEL